MMKSERHLKSLLTGKGGVDSRQLEKIFAKCRNDKEKMRKLVQAFCTAYLIDNKQNLHKQVYLDAIAYLDLWVSVSESLRTLFNSLPYLT